MLPVSSLSIGTIKDRQITFYIAPGLNFYDGKCVAGSRSSGDVG